LLERIGKNAKLWALERKDAWGVLPRTRTHSWPMLAVNLCFDALRSVPIPFFTNNQMACFEHVRDIEAENDICFVWPISEICFLYGPFLKSARYLVYIRKSNIAGRSAVFYSSNKYLHGAFPPAPCRDRFLFEPYPSTILHCRPPQRLHFGTLM